MYQTASDVLGHPEKKNQDWFDEHDKHGSVNTYLAECTTGNQVRL